MPFLTDEQAQQFGLSGSAPFDAEMGHIGFGANAIKNPNNLPDLAPNFPYTYAGSCSLAAPANSQGTIALRTETGGYAFMGGQHLAFCIDGSGTALDLNRITVRITTVQRDWMNIALPVSLLVASTSNPNGPRFMRDFIKPGSVVTFTFTNNTGTAGTMWYAITGTKYNR